MTRSPAQFGVVQTARLRLPQLPDLPGQHFAYVLDMLARVDYVCLGMGSPTQPEHEGEGHRSQQGGARLATPIHSAQRAGAHQGAAARYQGALPRARGEDQTIRPGSRNANRASSSPNANARPASAATVRRQLGFNPSSTAKR